jgi:hypothetical protein
LTGRSRDTTSERRALVKRGCSSLAGEWSSCGIRPTPVGDPDRPNVHPASKDTNETARLAEEHQHARFTSNIVMLMIGGSQVLKTSNNRGAKRLSVEPGAVAVVLLRQHT